MPMFAQVFSRFGVPYRSIIHPDSSQSESVEGYFLVDDAAASPYVPAKDFVRTHSVRGQVSIGGVLPSGAVFALFIFARDAITEDHAAGFSVLGPVMQLCYKRFDDSGRFWQ